MSPERWQQVKDLYHSVAERPPAEWESVLSGLRESDPELSREVESLLFQSDEEWILGPNPFANLDVLAKQRGGLVGDRYRLVRELGSGGFGVVWLARDERLHLKPVVVKFLSYGTQEAGAGDDWAIRRFADEARALARIDHPGVVGVFDAGRTPRGVPYLVMQYVEGVTLRSILGPEGLALVRTAQIVRQIGQALSAAHARGILHRDLKPENVMVQSSTSGEFVRLIDFGIAVISEARAGAAGANATATISRVVGTVAYMAPEQLRGEARPASDVYAMGVIAWEMLTGQVPGMDARWEGLHDRRPDVSPETFAVLRKMLSPGAADRYQDAAEAGEELALALTGAKPATVAQPAPLQQRVLDVAAQRQVPIRKPAEVVALIRRTESGGLAAVLEVDRDFSVKQEDVRSKPFQLEFPVGPQGNPMPLELGVRIECPDFEPKAAFKSIELLPDRDSEICTFLVTPQYLGELRINVEIVRRDVLVASRTLKTEAVPSERPWDASMVVVSIPLGVVVRAAPAQAAAGEFARLFQTAEPSAPPAPPRSLERAKPGEFTRMFGASETGTFNPEGPSEFTMFRRPPVPQQRTGAFASEGGTPSSVDPAVRVTGPQVPGQTFAKPVIPQPGTPEPVHSPGTSRRSNWTSWGLPLAIVGVLLLLLVEVWMTMKR
ncbi:MAG TPA: serine/threonine-protein kinase [Bryobacteraceae bacterium]|nr:serine/threonine-protein kinase [Bryobacteraceae bacterium]